MSLDLDTSKSSLFNLFLETIFLTNYSIKNISSIILLTKSIKLLIILKMKKKQAEQVTVEKDLA